MEQLHFTIEGVVPLLHHNPAAYVATANDKPKVSAKKPPTPEAEAELGLYRLKDGSIVHPASSIPRCVWKSVGGRKIGKSSARAIVEATVFELGEWFPVLGLDDRPLTEWEVDIRSVVVQKSRIIRGRPKFPEWRIPIVLEVDTEFISADLLREMLELAGRTVGIGDHRPKFGRFRVL